MTHAVLLIPRFLPTDIMLILDRKTPHFIIRIGQIYTQMIIVHMVVVTHRKNCYLENK